jgi:hypothetical protein
MKNGKGAWPPGRARTVSELTVALSSAVFFATVFIETLTSSMSPSRVASFTSRSLRAADCTTRSVSRSVMCRWLEPIAWDALIPVGEPSDTRPLRLPWLSPKPSRLARLGMRVVGGTKDLPGAGAPRGWRGPRLWRMPVIAAILASGASLSHSGVKRFASARPLAVSGSAKSPKWHAANYAASTGTLRNSNWLFFLSKNKYIKKTIPTLAQNWAKSAFPTKGDLCPGSDDFKFSALYTVFCNLHMGTVSNKFSLTSCL